MYPVCWCALKSCTSVLSAGAYLSNLWPKGGVSVLINLLVWLPAPVSGMCYQMS